MNTLIYLLNMHRGITVKLGSIKKMMNMAIEKVVSP